jgi:hypothetical protein
VLLAGSENAPAERTAHLIGMLLGMPVSAGFVDRAASRLTGSSSRSPKAGLWGPDDGRLSRPVLRAAGGETPCATNEGGCREVVRQLSSVLHERWRICGPPEPPCGGRLQTACMLR